MKPERLQRARRAYSVATASASDHDEAREALYPDSTIKYARQDETGREAFGTSAALSGSLYSAAR